MGSALRRRVISLLKRLEADNFRNRISLQLNRKKETNNEYYKNGAMSNVQSRITILQYTSRYMREKGDLHFREESEGDITHSKKIQKSSDVSTINSFPNK